MRALNKQIADLHRARQHQSRRIPRPRILNRARIPNGNISTFTNSDLTTVIAAKHLCTATRRHLQRLTGGHRISTVLNTLQQHGLARLGNHITNVIAGRSINAQSNRYTGITHLTDGGDPRPQPAIGTWAMGDTSPCLGKQINLLTIQLDAMSMPDVVTDPT